MSYSRLLISLCLSVFMPSAFGEVSTRKELGLEALWDAEIGRFKVFRPYGGAQLDVDSEEGFYSFNLSVLAWMNNAVDVENKLDRSRVEARSAILNLFFDSFLISVGPMIVDWGETFGYRPSDLVNARDIRNFSPLDLDANKIPTTALRVGGSLNSLQGEFIYCPVSAYPVLPKELGGLSVQEPTKNEAWFEQAEYGFKAGLLFDAANIDVFAYRHLNRIPALSFGADRIMPIYEAINSFGLSSAYSLETLVLRCDGLISPQHPMLVQTSQETIAYGRYSSLTLGIDWNYEDHTQIGLQAHLDRFPILDKQQQKGLSMQVRYELWGGDLSLLASVYRGIDYEDEREEATVNTKLGSNLNLSIGGERMHWAKGSPMAVTANTRNYTSKIAYQF
ncbi:MAG: hypothetical protein HRU09_11590 [Oligoflexales bacterium]|nr:hypothetical protein [Oligoflexales bacterium]